MEPGTLTIRSVVLKTVLGTWLLSVVIDCTIAAVRENSAQFELARLAWALLLLLTQCPRPLPLIRRSQNTKTNRHKFQISKPNKKIQINLKFRQKSKYHLPRETQASDTTNIRMQNTDENSAWIENLRGDCWTDIRYCHRTSSPQTNFHCLQFIYKL